MKKLFTVAVVYFFTFCPSAFAQIINQSTVVSAEVLENSLLKDNNGDGVLSIIAFGDSITRGVGDFRAANQSVSSAGDNISGEAGYPLRIETFLGLSVSNLGVPGETVSNQGIHRFAQIIASSSADIVIIEEGANDTIYRLNQTDYFRKIQTMINLARAHGIEPILTTLTPICCNRQARDEYASRYTREVRELAAVNVIPLADVRRAYQNACGGSNCYLLNRPEGLHPNIEGYDVMGEVITATLLQIDIFAQDGASKLEEILQLTSGAIKTVPDPVL